MKLRGVVIGIVFVLLVFSLQVLATDSPETRQTLKGLGGMYVIVDGVDPEIEQGGLTKAQIKTDAELKLGFAGIKMVSGGGPYLYVRVDVLKLKGEGAYTGVYTYEIGIELKQDVILSRDTGIEEFATTWSTGAFGLTPDLNIIRSTTKDYIDEFISAYLSVNPK